MNPYQPGEALRRTHMAELEQEACAARLLAELPKSLAPHRRVVAQMGMVLIRTGKQLTSYGCVQSA